MNFLVLCQLYLTKQWRVTVRVTLIDWNCLQFITVGTSWLTSLDHFAIVGYRFLNEINLNWKNDLRLTRHLQKRMYLHPRFRSN